MALASLCVRKGTGAREPLSCFQIDGPLAESVSFARDNAIQRSRATGELIEVAVCPIDPFAAVKKSGFFRGREDMKKCVVIDRVRPFGGRQAVPQFNALGTNLMSLVVPVGGALVAGWLLGKLV
jgi:hypothetical protein